MSHVHLPPITECLLDIYSGNWPPCRPHTWSPVSAQLGSFGPYGRRPHTDVYGCVWLQLAVKAPCKGHAALLEDGPVSTRETGNPFLKRLHSELTGTPELMVKAGRQSARAFINSGARSRILRPLRENEVLQVPFPLPRVMLGESSRVHFAGRLPRITGAGQACNLSHLSASVPAAPLRRGPLSTG